MFTFLCGTFISVSAIVCLGHVFVAIGTMEPAGFINPLFGACTPLSGPPLCLGAHAHSGIRYSVFVCVCVCVCLCITAITAQRLKCKCNQVVLYRLFAVFPWIYIRGFAK